MDSDQVISAVLDYLRLIEVGHGAEADNLDALAEVLDRLALAQHHVSPTFEEHPEPPSPDRARLAELTAERFPGLGLYNVPDPVTTRIGEAEITVGHALDDVGDIARDLWDVRWRLEHTSRNDALYAFAESYRLHWGRHLRHVQFYLQGRLDE
jgi:hypothetical protein